MRPNIVNALILTRPRSYLPSFIFCLTGYVAAGPQKLASLDLLALFLGYSVFLMGGTCALNSAYDRDEGPVNFLEKPPPPPRGLAIFGLAWMSLAYLVNHYANLQAQWLVSCCIVLSILYNMPVLPKQRRGKDIPVLDNAINAFGCGLFAVWLGYAFAHQPLDTSGLGLGIGFTLSVFGTFPVTQIYQLDLSRPRPKTPMSYSEFMGPARSLRVGALFTMLGGLVAAINSQSTLAGLCVLAGLSVCAGVMIWGASHLDRTMQVRSWVIQSALTSRLAWIALTYLSH